MKATLIAYTKFAEEDYDGNLFPDIDSIPWSTEHDYILNPDQLAEFAGRACYQSWERPNPATATNQGYLANILANEHYSVLEHASATFYIEGVSRSLTHELIRHRHLSFSQLSQRYVDESLAQFVIPPAVRELGEAETVSMQDEFRYVRESYSMLADVLEGSGIPRKQAREAARAVLPNATETKIVVTGNMRTWREVLLKRGSEHADAEIRQLALELYKQLGRIAPNCFQDFKTVEVSGVTTIKRKFD